MCVMRLLAAQQGGRNAAPLRLAYISAYKLLKLILHAGAVASVTGPTVPDHHFMSKGGVWER